MNVINASNENSAILSLLDQSAKDVLTYGTQSVPSHARERVYVAPTGTASFGSLVSFELPKYGLLEKLTLHLDISITNGGTETVVGSLGLNAVEYMELVSQNRILCRVSRTQFLTEVRRMEYSKQGNVMDATNIVANDASGSTECFLPFFGYLGHAERQGGTRTMLDLSFVEGLHLRVKFDARSAVSANSSTVISTAEIIADFRVLPEGALRSLEEANFGSGVLNMISQTEFPETEVSDASAITAKTQATNVPINSNGVAVMTTVRARATTLTDKRDSLQIYKVVLKGSGREIGTWYGEELRLLDVGAIGSSQHSNLDDGKYQLVLDWSLLPGLPEMFSGGISWREIAAPSIDVYLTSSNTGTTFEVVHKQVEVIQINPSNGRITSSIST